MNLRINIDGIKYIGKSTFIKKLSRQLQLYYLNEYDYFVDTRLIDELESVRNTDLVNLFKLTLKDKDDKINPVTKMMLQMGIRYQMYHDLNQGTEKSMLRSIQIVDRSALSSLVYNVSLEKDYLFNSYDTQDRHVCSIFHSIVNDHFYRKTVFYKKQINILLKPGSDLDKYREQVVQRNPKMSEQEIDQEVKVQLNKATIYSEEIDNILYKDSNPPGLVYSEYGITVLFLDPLVILIDQEFLTTFGEKDDKGTKVLVNVIAEYNKSPQALVSYINTIKSIQLHPIMPYIHDE